jgi:MFS transporter, DHA2 family, multidrug resistance protein
VVIIVWALTVRAGLGLVFPPLLNLGLRTLTREEISAASGLLNITRQIAGMAGIAGAGVLLERWHYAYHLAGSEHLALTWRGLDATERLRQWFLVSQGEMGEFLVTKTQALVSRYLMLEAFGAPFQDCFIAMALVFVVAAIASLCISGGEASKS